MFEISQTSLVELSCSDDVEVWFEGWSTLLRDLDMTLHVNHCYFDKPIYLFH